MAYEWPGNVRQLKNVIERLVIMADRPFIDMVYLLDNLNTPLIEKSDSVPETLQELKRPRTESSRKPTRGSKRHLSSERSNRATETSRVPPKRWACSDPTSMRS